MDSYFLDHLNLAEVDATFWSMTAKEISEMDPQQRLALEVVYECLQNSGTTKWQGKNIGTYFGIYGEVSIVTPSSNSRDQLTNFITGLGRHASQRKSTYWNVPYYRLR
jgi:acyl transferase domain-containing protein